MKLINLREGDVFTVSGLPHLGAFKLVRKHASGCTVRTTKLKRVDFESNGKPISFKAPAKGRTIFGASTLVELQEGI
ncbi:MAG: hypothetical protein GY896_23070 [Gammaproteobacteria bacterium]|nr:hypothetical protein [Gammaproteobacteria bacterium]